MFQWNKLFWTNFLLFLWEINRLCRILKTGSLWAKNMFSCLAGALNLGWFHTFCYCSRFSPPPHPVPSSCLSPRGHRMAPSAHLHVGVSGSQTRRNEEMALLRNQKYFHKSTEAFCLYIIIQTVSQDHPYL